MNQGSLVKSRLNGTYTGAKGNQDNTRRSKYCQGHREEVVAKGGKESRDVALDGITRAAGPYFRNKDRYLDTWWECGGGSTPFFWNWTKEYQEEVQDGQPHFLTGDFSTFVHHQDPPSDRGDGELVRKKVVQVCLKGYIEVGLVVSLIHYFCVEC